MNVLKDFVSPIIVGIFVLLGQFFIQPIIAERSLSKQELWKSKYDTYLIAIKLVDREFVNMRWPKSAELPDGYEPDGDLGAASREEINNVYAKLCLLSNDSNIPKRFMKCFGFYEKEISIGYRPELIAAFRNDLGSSRIDIRPEDLKFVIKRVYSSNKREIK